MLRFSPLYVGACLLQATACRDAKMSVLFFCMAVRKQKVGQRRSSFRAESALWMGIS